MYKLEKDLKLQQIDKELRMMKLRAEWANNQPTMQELRKEKSNLSKLSKALDKVANHIESFDLDTFITKHSRLAKIHEYFFPESYEYIEVVEDEVPHELQSTTKHIITKDSNVIHVNFGSK